MVCFILEADGEDAPRVADLWCFRVRHGGWCITVVLTLQAFSHSFVEVVMG